MSKMWSGRFSEKSSTLLDRFNASIPFDIILYKEDIQGSIAHVRMLAKMSILTNEESQTIIQALETVRNEIEHNKIEFDISNEDIHMAIEQRVTELIGDIGKKIHTARSRND